MTRQEKIAKLESQIIDWQEKINDAKRQILNLEKLGFGKSTGRRDKNGIEICTGDLLRITTEIPLHATPAVYTGIIKEDPTSSPTSISRFYVDVAPNKRLDGYQFKTCECEIIF